MVRREESEMIHDILMILLWATIFVAPLAILDMLDPRNKRK